MTIIDCVRQQAPLAVVPECSEEGCELRMNGLRNYIVLKGELARRDIEICDCIIFLEGNPLIVALVELKGKTVHASAVVTKLTNGTNAALEILANSDTRQRPIFRHLVLAKRWHRGTEFRVITSRRIHAAGKKYLILPKPCGFSLAQAI